MKSLKSFLFITVPTLVFLFIFFEIVFRTLIPACDPPKYYYDPTEEIIRLDPRKPTGIFSIGPFAKPRAKWHVNNAGWNSPIDYHEQRIPGKTRIAIIGDSYVEALQVDSRDSFSRQLAQMLGEGYEVYSFGISAAPLSQYLYMSRYVCRHYQPDILIINVVHNDFLASIYGLHRWGMPFLTIRFAPDSSISEYLYGLDSTKVASQKRKDFYAKSAVFRYFINNLAITHIPEKIRWPEKEEFSANVVIRHVNKKRSAIFRLTDYILKALRKENPDRIIIVMMDGLREDIYNQKDEAKNPLAWLWSMTEQHCRKHGIQFINLHPIFKSDYMLHQRKFNPENDGHWNEYGHHVVARALYDEIMRLKGGDKYAHDL